MLGSRWERCWRTSATSSRCVTPTPRPAGIAAASPSSSPSSRATSPSWPTSCGWRSTSASTASRDTTSGPTSTRSRTQSMRRSPESDRPLERGRRSRPRAAAAERPCRTASTVLLENIFLLDETRLGPTSRPAGRARSSVRRRGSARRGASTRAAPPTRSAGRSASSADLTAGPHGGLERRRLPRLVADVSEPRALPGLQHAQARGERHEPLEGARASPVIGRITTLLDDEPLYAERFDEVPSKPSTPPGARAGPRDGAEAWHIDERTAARLRRSAYRRTFGFYEGSRPSRRDEGWHHIGPNGAPPTRAASPGAGTSRAGAARCAIATALSAHRRRRLRRATRSAGATPATIAKAMRSCSARTVCSTHIDRDGGLDPRALVRRPRCVPQGLRARSRRATGLDTRRPGWRAHLRQASLRDGRAVLQRTGAGRAARRRASR
jgi:hypothetical protein